MASFKQEEKYKNLKVQLIIFPLSFDLYALYTESER